MPATPRTLARPPLWPWVLPFAGLFLLIPLAARAHDGAHLHPHGADLLWLAGAAALLTGAGGAIARARR
ncbi:MAG: hypothetical protein ACT4OK_13280 [Gemmobacter sp.]